jgi:hypothetical protein
MLLRAPSGTVHYTTMIPGSCVRGPHAIGVGGAQPGAERL